MAFSATARTGSELRCRIGRDEFADAVAWVARSLAARPVNPVMAGLLITGGPDGLNLSGFDYETSRQTSIAADIHAQGRVVVSGRLLSEITKALQLKPVDLVVDGARVVLTCGASKFSLPMMPAEDYPALPVSPERTGTVPAELFSQAVAQVAVAASRDDAVPMLTGVRVEIDGDTVTLAATDRFRLAVRQFTWQTDAPHAQAEVVVPAKTLAEVAKGIDPTAAVDLALGSDVAAGRLMGIHSGGRHSTSRLLDTEFPQYRRLFPQSYTAVAVLEIRGLIEAVKRVALVSRAPCVLMEFDPQGSVRLSVAGDADSNGPGGEAEEFLPAQYAGQPMQISFNAAYLVDGLASLGAERVIIGFNSPKSPAVLCPAAAETTLPAAQAGQYPVAPADHRYLLMPVRIP